MDMEFATMQREISLLGTGKIIENMEKELITFHMEISLFESIEMEKCTAIVLSTLEMEIASLLSA